MKIADFGLRIADFNSEIRNLQSEIIFCPRSLSRRNYPPGRSPLPSGLEALRAVTQRSGHVYNIYIIYYTTNNRCKSKKNRGRVHVAKTIIIKNFPEDLHRRAKAKAALEGITLKALIIKLLETYLEEFRT